MSTFFIATSNAGKQKEIEKYASLYGKNIRVLFPDQSNSIRVEESGQTFEENALLKAKAYRQRVNDNTFAYVGDDSGIVIPALGGEPGVFTRRWAGYEMTDDEILNHCLDKMSGLRGDDRKAVLKTVLAIVSPDDTVRYLQGSMEGRILEKPLENVDPQPGFPFRTIFWVNGIDMPISQLHALTPEQRQSFLTHREYAFKQLFAE
jgi:XTP/dITP diphosphohydrolase